MEALILLAYGAIIVSFLIRAFGNEDSSYSPAPYKKPPSQDEIDHELDKKKTHLSDEQIEYYVKLLKARIPGKATAYNAPFRYAHTDIDKLPPEQKERHLQNYVAEVCKFLLLPKSIHTMFVHSMKEPGKYVYQDGLHHIQIRPGLADSKVYWAVLAHEITHYYLNTHNIVLPDTQSNEYLTEVASVYLGFGFKMLDGYRSFVISDDGRQQKTESVGYINRDSILRAIIATAKARKQQPYLVIEHFSSQNVKWAKRQLFDLIKEYEAHKQKRGNAS